MEVWNNCIHPEEPWLSSIHRCCHHGRRAHGRQNSEWRGESSTPNLCHSLSPSNAQRPSLRILHLSPSFSPLSSQDSAAEDVIYVHLDLGTLSKRWFTTTTLGPMYRSTEPIIYEEFNINQDHAEPWPGPILWAHRVLQIKDLDLLLKGFLLDTPSPPKQPSSSEVRSGVQEL